MPKLDHVPQLWYGRDGDILACCPVVLLMTIDELSITEGCI
jgi:hypothetical protein